MPTMNVKNVEIVSTAGDLLEICDAANAWAHELRAKADKTSEQFGGLPVFQDDVRESRAKADHIDAAVEHVRSEVTARIRELI